MNEFEKWWLMEAQNIIGVGRANEEDVAKEAWKAALDWVLENFDGKTDMLELALRIRKEMDYE